MTLKMRKKKFRERPGKADGRTGEGEEEKTQRNKMKTDDKWRTPRPCPAGTEFHLLHWTALLHPRLPEPPTRQANREPRNLVAR